MRIAGVRRPSVSDIPFRSNKSFVRVGGFSSANGAPGGTRPLAGFAVIKRIVVGSGKNRRVRHRVSVGAPTLYRGRSASCQARAGWNRVLSPELPRTALAGTLAAAALGLAPALAEAAPGSDAVVAATTIVGVPNGASASVIASCFPGMRVTGGGVNTSTGPDPSNNPRVGYSVQLSAPVDGILPSGIVPDGSPATGWYGSVYNLSGAAQDFKVFALCSRNTDATVEVTDGLIAPTGTGVADRATCPPGRGWWAGPASAHRPHPPGGGPGVLRHERQRPA